jgi:hypothetical protein
MHHRGGEEAACTARERNAVACAEITFNQTARAYEPIVYFNEFWNLKEHAVRVNDTVATLPLWVSYQALGIFKWQLYVSMEDNMRQQREWTGAVASEESDTFKTMLLDTNPWLLALTAAVTILHSIFDFLAFKNGMPNPN